MVAAKPKACLVCRQRKIKCDMLQREPGQRCTNCETYNVPHCYIPEPKKRESKKLQQILQTHPELTGSPHAIHLDPRTMLKGKLRSWGTLEHHDGIISVPVTSQLLKDYMMSNPQEFPEVIDVDPIDLEYLTAIGCFTLPDVKTCNKYIDVYFEFVNPQFPVVDEVHFRKDYANFEKGDIPSLVLLHSVLYAGSFFYREDDWTDEQRHRQMLNSRNYYRKGQAMIDLNVEVDTLCQIQSSIILNKYWYQEKGFKSTTFTYISANIFKAYTLGMHKDQTDNPLLSEYEKSLYKKIWWSLYGKDCLVSGIIGRPYSAHGDGFTVEMVTPEDFGPECDIRGLFFIHRIELIVGFKKIMKRINNIEINNYKQGETANSLFFECDQFLLNWIKKLPSELTFHLDAEGNVDESKNNVFGAVLAIEYYTLLTMLHKVYIFQIEPNNDIKVSVPFSSWAITFKSCHMIAIIGNFFRKSERDLYIYPGVICSFVLFAATMLMYQMYNQDLKIVDLAKKDIELCIGVLESLKDGWPFASIFHFFMKSFFFDQARRDRIIKRMLKYGSKAQLDSKNINSNITMKILDDIRVLPKIRSVDNSKLRDSYVQNIFKSARQHDPKPTLPNLPPSNFYRQDQVSKTLGLSLGSPQLPPMINKSPLPPPIPPTGGSSFSSNSTNDSNNSQTSHSSSSQPNLSSLPQSMASSSSSYPQTSNVPLNHTLMPMPMRMQMPMAPPPANPHFVKPAQAASSALGSVPIIVQPPLTAYPSQPYYQQQPQQLPAQQQQQHPSQLYPAAQQMSPNTRMQTPNTQATVYEETSIPFDPLPNITSSDWNPRLETKNRSNGLNTADVPEVEQNEFEGLYDAASGPGSGASSSLASDNYIDEFTLFSRLTAGTGVEGFQDMIRNLNGQRP